MSTHHSGPSSQTQLLDPTSPGAQYLTGNDTIASVPPSPSSGFDTPAPATPSTESLEVPVRPVIKRRPVTGHLVPSRPVNFFSRLHNAFSPSSHSVLEKHHGHFQTSRPYCHKQQRHRLQRKSWAEFLITLLLCIAYLLILYRFSHNHYIDKNHRSNLNALITVVALLLGVNMSNSFRSYAKMIRWRFLASGYRSLTEFNLIMGCDSLTNVMRLVYEGRRKDRRFPLNSKVQVFALLGLIVQIGIVVCVGVIGLTYNLHFSAHNVNIRTGPTSSINLTTIYSDNFYSDWAFLQIWGIRGYALSPSKKNSLSKSQARRGSYLRDGGGTSRKIFTDYNPDNSHYLVTDGEYGDLDYFVYDRDNQPVTEKLLGMPGPGGLYVTASMNDTSGCGERCTQVIVFQARSLEKDQLSSTFHSHSMRFECNNTVSDVQNENDDPLPSIYHTSPRLSRMLAGMLAWSGAPTNSTNEYQVYPINNEFGWSSVPSESEVADYVSQWTIAGVAAMDRRDGSTIGSGLTRMFPQYGQQPVQAQTLDVQWWATGFILGALPLVQFCGLVIVIFFANKVIIKDDDPIAVANMYQSILNKFGDHGCMLTGRELVEMLEDEHGLGRVVFGTRDKDGIKHVDVFEERSGVQPPRVFAEGTYDGCGDV